MRGTSRRSRRRAAGGRAAERGEQRSQKGAKGDSTASSDGSKTGVDSIDSLVLEIDARLSILRGTTLTNASRGLVHALFSLRKFAQFFQLRSAIIMVLSSQQFREISANDRSIRMRMISSTARIVRIDASYILNIDAQSISKSTSSD